MSIRALLAGPTGQGGDDVYMRMLAAHPPNDVEYRIVGPFHHGASGAPSQTVLEIALNRLVHPLLAPDWGIRALRLRDHFDLVHVHAQPNRIAGRGDTPLVMSEGSSPAVYLSEYVGWDDARIERRYARTRQIYRALGINDRLLAMDRVSLVYVFSKWGRDINLRWGADPSKLNVLYPGFPVPSPITGRESRTFNFLFIGTDFERKGGFDVVEAFDRINREHPETRLTVVTSDPWGPSPDWLTRTWVSRRRRNRVLKRLEVLERDGLVERQELASRKTLMEHLYPQADAFVVPPLAEGFGFTNVEAMSVGLPVISSDAGPMPEVVDDKVTGLLVAPGDVDALAGAMARLAGDRDQAARMGAAGRVVFLERFTIDRFRAGLGELYRTALER